jgi:hypothetical protein
MTGPAHLPLARLATVNAFAAVNGSIRRPSDSDPTHRVRPRRDRRSPTYIVWLRLCRLVIRYLWSPAQ